LKLGFSPARKTLSGIGMIPSIQEDEMDFALEEDMVPSIDVYGEAVNHGYEDETGEPEEEIQVGSRKSGTGNMTHKLFGFIEKGGQRS